MNSPCVTAFAVAQCVALLLTPVMPAPAGAPPGCRPGSFLKPGVQLCVQCEAGVDFTADYNWDAACKTCTTCTGGRHAKSDCTVTQNTVCGCHDNEDEHADGCSPKQGIVSEVQTLDVGAQLGRQEAKLDNLTLTSLELKNLGLYVLTNWRRASAQTALGDRPPTPLAREYELIVLNAVGVVLLVMLIVLFALLHTPKLKELLTECRMQRGCASNDKAESKIGSQKTKEENSLPSPTASGLLNQASSPAIDVSSSDPGDDERRAKHDPIKTTSGQQVDLSDNDQQSSDRSIRGDETQQERRSLLLSG